MDRRRCVMSKMITIQIPKEELEGLREEIRNLSVDELLGTFALTRNSKVSSHLLQLFLDYYLHVQNICVEVMDMLDDAE